MSFTKISILLGLCLCSVALQAQKFSLGLKAGVNGTFANFPDQKDSLKASIKPGFSMGGFIMFPMKKNNSFVAEAGFTQVGKKWKYSPNGDRWSATYNMWEASMALRKTFKLKIKENIASTWFVNIGPNVNYWFGGKGKMIPRADTLQTNVWIQRYSYVFDQKPNGSYKQLHINNENRWLFGINFGIGTTFTTLKNQKIITELRMTWGQTYLGQRHSENLGGTPGINDEMSLKCNLKTLTFSVGYIFDRDIQKGRLGKSTKKLK